MILSIKQTHELLKIIDRNQLIAIGQELGPEFLTVEDQKVLEDYGVEIDDLYSKPDDSIFTAFHFGMLAESLHKAQITKLTYPELKGYIRHGDYIPLTIRELVTIQSIKMQSFNDIKSLGSRIFKDVNQVLLTGSVTEQQDYLREKIAEGVTEKWNVRKIANEIGDKTGDWSRDFDRIVTYVSTQAFEEGKAAMILRNTDEDDPKVYKAVFSGACPHCVRLYLTGDIGSQPRIFKLSELRANGNNIGVKTAEWKATLGPVHPYCRCILNYLPPGYIWNDKIKQFEAPKKDETFVSKRKPIKVWFAGQEQFV